MPGETMTSAEYRKAQGLPPPGADRRPAPLTERELHRDVARYFDHVSGELFAFHVPNGERRSRLTAAILVGMGVKAGAPDFVVLLGSGRTLWLELKTENGRLSCAQADFRATARRLGHTYAVCRSVADVHAALEIEGVAFREDGIATALRGGA